MNKPKKLAFHTRQVCQSLKIRDSSEKTFQILLDSLLNTHQEYKLEPIIRFKIELQQVLNEYITSIDDNKPQTVAPTPVLSLNQTLRNNYQNQASKRQRPIETENTSINNNNISDANNTIDSSLTTSDVLPLPLSSPSTTLDSRSITTTNNQPANKVKIKAKKPKQQDDNDNNNNSNDEVIYECHSSLPYCYCLYCVLTIISLVLSMIHIFINAVIIYKYTYI